MHWGGGSEHGSGLRYTHKNLYLFAERANAGARVPIYEIASSHAKQPLRRVSVGSISTRGISFAVAL